MKVALPSLRLIILYSVQPLFKLKLKKVRPYNPPVFLKKVKIEFKKHSVKKLDTAKSQVVVLLGKHDVE